jgi:hypothetical protein
MGFVVWAHLSDQRQVEMVLLKGHLLLEILLTNALNKFEAGPSHLKNQNLTFSKKLTLLQTVTPKGFFAPAELYHYIAEANRLRNQLSHHWDFRPHHEELHTWAKRVLRTFPDTPVSRHTFRVEVIAAFSALSTCLMENTNKTGKIDNMKVSAN